MPAPAQIRTTSPEEPAMSFPARHVPPAATADIDALLAELVARWHEVDPAHAEDGLRGRICDLHRFNFLLWHEEDIARSPDVTDARIAAVKRAIDHLLVTGMVMGSMNQPWCAAISGSFPSQRATACAPSRSVGRRTSPLLVIGIETDVIHLVWFENPRSGCCQKA